MVIELPLTAKLTLYFWTEWHICTRYMYVVYMSSCAVNMYVHAVNIYIYIYIYVYILDIYTDTR